MTFSRFPYAITSGLTEEAVITAQDRHNIHDEFRLKSDAGTSCIILLYKILLLLCTAGIRSDFALFGMHANTIL